jgi:hypothetical protein
MRFPGRARQHDLAGIRTAAYLNFLASIYPGYHAAGSVADLIVGTLYAILDGALGGLIFGWLYNYLARK